eukprot:Hpha_TRINITY_DN12051_c0_g1::TRINITY_DN12051_c0_g1_i1::g.140990::m.140990
MSDQNGDGGNLETPVPIPHPGPTDSSLTSAPPTSLTTSPRSSAVCHALPLDKEDAAEVDSELLRRSSKRTKGTASPLPPEDGGSQHRLSFRTFGSGVPLPQQSPARTGSYSAGGYSPRSRGATTDLPVTEEEWAEEEALAAQITALATTGARELRHRKAFEADEVDGWKELEQDAVRSVTDARKRAVARKQAAEAARRGAEADLEQQARWEVEQEESHARKALAVEGALIGVVRREGNLRGRIEGAEAAVRRDVLQREPRENLQVSEGHIRRYAVGTEHRERTERQEEGLRRSVETQEAEDRGDMDEIAAAVLDPAPVAPQHSREKDANPRMPRGRAAIPWRPVGRRREGTFEKRLRHCVEKVTGTGPPVPPAHPQVHSRVVESQPHAAALSPRRGEVTPDESPVLWTLALEQEREAKRRRAAAMIASRQSRAAEIRAELRQVKERSKEATKQETSTLTTQARQQRREKLQQQLERADPLASVRRAVPSDRLPIPEPPPEGRPRRLAPLNAPKPSLMQQEEVDKIVRKIRRLDRNEAWEKRRGRRLEAQRQAQAAAASEEREREQRPTLLSGEVPRHILYGSFRSPGALPSSDPASSSSGDVAVHELLCTAAEAAAEGRTEEASRILRRATLATTGKATECGVVDTKERTRLRVAALNNQACLSISQGDMSQALEFLGMLRLAEQAGGIGEDPRALYNLSICQEGNGALHVAFGAAKRAEKLSRKEIRKRAKSESSDASKAALDSLQTLVVDAARQQARLQAKCQDMVLGSPRSGFKRAVKVAEQRLGLEHTLTQSIAKETQQIERAMQRDDKRQSHSKFPVAPPPVAVWITQPDNYTARYRVTPD